MFVKNQFSAVRAELSAARAKPIPRGGTPGWAARAAAARAPPPLVLDKIPLTKIQTMHSSTESWSKGFSRTLPVYPSRKFNIPETLALGRNFGLILITLCAAL